MTEPDVDDASGTDRVASWRLLAGNPVTVVSVVVLTVVIVVAVGAQWLAPYGINDVDVPNALRAPSASHLFGTDELGRDVLSRVLVAVQESMRVAVVSVAFAVVVGVAIGVVAGYRGGWVDTVFMRAVDVVFAFPVLLLARSPSWPFSVPASPPRCSRSASSTHRSSRGFRGRAR